MPGQLVSLSESPNILLDKPILVLGRHPECDVQLNSRKISRRHCCIAQVSDSLLVRDLGSTNGIRINGSRVLEGKLKNGDELTVGNFRFTLDLGGSSARPPAPVARGNQPAAPARGQSIPRLEEVDPLEDAEEPVELDEDPRAVPPRGVKAPAPPPAPPARPVARDSTANTESESLFPDHLTLRPPSGPYPRPPEPGK